MKVQVRKKVNMKTEGWEKVKFYLRILFFETMKSLTRNWNKLFSYGQD